jgi:hypothetical protein
MAVALHTAAYTHFSSFLALPIQSAPWPKPTLAAHHLKRIECVEPEHQSLSEAITGHTTVHKQDRSAIQKSFFFADDQAKKLMSR